jgi:hypothetical protein
MLEFMQSHPRLVDVVLALSTGILIAAVSAWITVQLSLRRFRTERWWERKVEAYERIIGALHDAKAFADTHLHAGLEQRDVPDEIGGAAWTIENRTRGTPEGGRPRSFPTAGRGSLSIEAL